MPGFSNGNWPNFFHRRHIRKSASKLSTVILISGILIFSSAIPQPGFSQEEETIQPDVNSSDQVRSVSEESKIPPAVTEYMGRTIAETMSYKGAYWLDRDEREREERCSLLLNNLGLKPKMVVCDLGCGSGFHSLQIAELIPGGVVLAVDVQPEMLEIILERAEKKGLRNVTPILGSYFTPRLPPESVDLVLLVDVYHEFSHPEQMLAGIRSALKPNGQIALVEFRILM